MIHEYLSEHYPDLTVEVTGFSEAVKSVAWKVYGWAGLKDGDYYDIFYSQKEQVIPDLGLTPREIWIHLGNGLRDLYSDTWVEFLFNAYKADVVLIKDLGFKNEARRVFESGGMMVRVDRNGCPNALDARETELDNWTAWDYVVTNFGEIEDLEDAACEIGEDIAARIRGY